MFKKSLALLTACLSLQALYVGNPAEPNMVEEGMLFTKETEFNATLGYQKDMVFDRRMKADGSIEGHFQEFEIWADQGVLTFTIFDRFEALVSIGANKICAAQVPGSAIINEYETHDQLTWGAGGRILVYQNEALSVGVEGGYQASDPKFAWLGRNGTPVSHSKKSHISMSEWQVGLGLAYQIDMFYPYLALKYSNAQAHFKHLPEGFVPHVTSFKATNRNKFGVALGTSLTPNRFFALTVEARLVDEVALSLNGELVF